MEFNERLKQLRKETGLNQKNFAASLNIGQSKYNKWENGTNSPSYDDLYMLAECFGCTTDYLFGLSDIKIYCGDEKDELIFILQEEITTLKGALNGTEQALKSIIACIEKTHDRI